MEMDVLKHANSVRKCIGYVAQSSMLDINATGRETLILQGQLYRVPSHSLRRRIDEMIELFQLGGEVDRLVRTYSGGMKRRLELALCLIHQPSVVIVDEPTAGLDPESRAVLWSRIKDLSEKDGIAVLLTTHNMQEADVLGERIAILDKGQIVTCGTPSELKDSLRGDIVAVECGDHCSLKAQNALQHVDEITKVILDGDTIYAHVNDGARCIPLILRLLDNSGISVNRASTMRPSLEDVYLSATGRKYIVGAARRVPLR